MKVAVIDNTGEISAREKTVYRKIALEALKHTGVPARAELCISFISDTEMRELNRTYRNIDRATDVLSFPQSEGPDFTLLGDVVISTETALRHSRKYGVTYHEELKKLIVHGILHLLGHDHKKKREKEIMREKEQELLLALDDY